MGNTRQTQHTCIYMLNEHLCRYMQESKSNASLNSLFALPQSIYVYIYNEYCSHNGNMNCVVHDGHGDDDKQDTHTHTHTSRVLVVFSKYCIYVYITFVHSKSSLLDPVCVCYCYVLFFVHEFVNEIKSTTAVQIVAYLTSQNDKQETQTTSKHTTEFFPRARSHSHRSIIFVWLTLCIILWA